MRAVNVYVVEDRDGLVLVDSGWADANGESALGHGLRQLGCAPGDVRRILVTHAHHDHYTYALALRATHASEVRLGRGERPTVRAMMHRAENPRRRRSS